MGPVRITGGIGSRSITDIIIFKYNNNYRTCYYIAYHPNFHAVNMNHRHAVAAVLTSAIMLGSILCVTAMGPVVMGKGPTEGEQVIDGEAFWNHLTNITTISDAHEAYRVAGSTGAEATADYIEQSFNEIGLETRSEGFMFTGWDLDEGSFLRIDEDGDPSTLDDVHPIASFVPEAFSWPKGERVRAFGDGRHAHASGIQLPGHARGITSFG